jgi:hypothetical protein
MASPFPFTAGQVLTAAQMNSIGESGIAYTPTWNNLTVGNATQNFRFMRVNKLVYVRGLFTFGSTTSMSGVPNFSLPVTAFSTSQYYLGTSYLLDAGNVVYFGSLTYLNTTNIEINVINAASTYAVAQAISTTVPFTWGNTDIIRVEFVYEAA